nr:immunoglobulin heavy chain junction region [Macaca mulatta]MPN70211.1 immunoglobulin heavy chain junction region [Macaca mulatta]MPN70299.1 immunoglobulin heavy chain junction region [Macaca mulatta]MPN70300.1 immunoglobulin heavy chain junction region [Macaca mulatta]MPN70317.1 immunoglobulin heavy chain junction region [Macaca mulatta]
CARDRFLEWLSPYFDYW